MIAKHLMNSKVSYYPLTKNELETIDFLKITSKRGVGKVIQAKNYVGVIQMKNGNQIQILPKIINSSINETIKIFLRMLRSMKDFPSKVFNDATLKVDRMNLYEIFINMYIQEARMLVKKGLRSNYIHVEDNLNFFKGKLLTSDHIKTNIVHKERFYASYDEFVVNRPENRLIKSTLLKLQMISSSSENIKEIRQLLVYFEMVEPSLEILKDFSMVIIDRNTKDYESLIIWSKVFLLNQSFSTFSGNTTAKALLFPMEKVFESYVAKYLKQSIVGSLWDFSTQDRAFFLFDEPQKFALRPDIVLTLEKRKVILDTKWKALNNDPRQNYGISQSDMYQMYAYSKRYGTAEIWLLYPENEAIVDSSEISFSSHYRDDENNVRETYVRLFSVDLKNIDKSMNKLMALVNSAA